MNDSMDAIIKKRLEVDERPLKKLVKRVFQVVQKPDPSVRTEDFIEADFESYDLTLRRLQLLLKANAREIERYESEIQIVNNTYSEAEREISRLKDELAHEKQAQEDRASFDVIAYSIQKEAPKTRKSQRSIIAKLEDEVSELEEEKASYNAVWQTRKNGFDDIMKQLAKLQQEISGEKADAELRDAADSEDEEGAILNHQGTPDSNRSIQVLPANESPTVNSIPEEQPQESQDLCKVETEVVPDRHTTALAEDSMDVD